MNFFIALTVLSFLFLLSTIVPIPHQFSLEEMEKWESAPFNGLEFIPNLRQNIPLCQWIGWNISRGVFPILIISLLFSTLAPFFSVLTIIAQIYIPSYYPKSLLKPHFGFTGFLGMLLILNPFGFLTSLLASISVYFLVKKYTNPEIRIHSSIFTGMLSLLVISGIRGGFIFLPIFLGLSILFYRNFSYFQKVVDNIPVYCQVWTHDDFNHNKKTSPIYEAKQNPATTTATPKEADKLDKNIIIDIKNEYQDMGQ